MSIITLASRSVGEVSDNDPFYNNVVLLLHGNGVNNGVVFTDSSLYNHAPISIQNGIKTSNDITLVDNGVIKTIGGNDCLKYAVAPE